MLTSYLALIFPKLKVKYEDILYASVTLGSAGNPGFEAAEKGEEVGSMQLNICAGVIDRARVLGFEKMLWRVSKGNVYVKFSDIEEEIKDPKTGDILYKAVFIIFYQVRKFIAEVFKHPVF